MTDRLGTVRDAVESFTPCVVQTPAGCVDITSIVVTDSCVEVTVCSPAGGDPHFRIFNPPVMCGGDVDPIRAVAHAVALAGGACG